MLKRRSVHRLDGKILPPHSAAEYSVGMCPDALAPGSGLLISVCEQCCCGSRARSNFLGTHFTTYDSGESPGNSGFTSDVNNVRRELVAVAFVSLLLTLSKSAIVHCNSPKFCTWCYVNLLLTVVFFSFFYCPWYYRSRGLKK